MRQSPGEDEMKRLSSLKYTDPFEREGDLFVFIVDIGGGMAQVKRIGYFKDHGEVVLIAAVNESLSLDAEVTPGTLVWEPEDD